MVNNCSISSEKAGRFTTVNTQLNTACTITQQEASQEVSEQAEYSPEPAVRPAEVESWRYVTSSTTRNTINYAGVLMIVVINRIYS